MPEQLQSSDQVEQAASAKVVKIVPPIFTPVAIHITQRPRAIAVQSVKDLVPPGNPKPALVTAARDLVLALIAAHPEDYQDIEVKIEIGGALAHQIMVIVIPHKY